METNEKWLGREVARINGGCFGDKRVKDEHMDICQFGNDHLTGLAGPLYIFQTKFTI